MIAPSFYGYKPAAAEAATNGTAADGDDPMGEPTESESKAKKTYYFGDDGVNVWRSGMEVGNFMVDGMGKSETRWRPWSFGGRLRTLWLTVQCTMARRRVRCSSTSCATAWAPTRANTP